MNPNEQNIIFSWVVWHFYEMPKILFSGLNDYLWFGSNFFSIPDLISTLFSPWKRYQWSYPKGFDIGGFFNSLISNIFSRIIGFLTRTFLIIFGVIVEGMILFIGLIIILIWMLIPFLLILLLLFILVY